MTRFPTDTREVVGLEGPEYGSYKVGPTCAVPGCTKFADHAHHIFSRALMAGAYNYVRLPDGMEVGNLSPLCYIHHNDVTENRTRIRYENNKFYWDDGELLGLLTEQPPRPFGRVVSPLARAGHERNVCDGCGRTLPKPKLPDEKIEAKKPRKTWAVAVPYTEEENGADTLDALLEAAREEMDKYGLDWGQGHRVKFHVLSTALGLFVTHADAILSDA